MSKDSLSHDQTYSLLAKRRRRYVLYCLYLFTNPISLPDIAGQISEWEYGKPEGELLDERLSIYTSLYHNHIPALSDADVVAYDQSEDVVELSQNAPQLRPYLEGVVETDLETTDISTL